MEISQHEAEGATELRVIGRLDAFWADHLNGAIEQALHQGRYHLRLNMAGVSYMSSAGIRVLVRYRKQTRQLSGSFVVIEASEAVRSVLQLAGLDTLFSAAAPVVAVGGSAVRVDWPGAVVEVFEVTAGAMMRCVAVGNPDAVARDAAEEESLRVSRSMVAVGVGALGDDSLECRARAGEFLAVAGSAAYLPTDGTGVPDYSVATGAFQPELRVLYGLKAEGDFRFLARFEPGEDGQPLTVTRLVRGCLQVAGTDSIALVIAAESAGLIGTALRRSPLETVDFGLPAVRDWLSFSPERMHRGALVLIGGFASTAPDPRLARLLRPMEGADGPSGHFHGAAFPYHPLRKGRIDLNETVASLYDSQRLLDVLHLLRDDREIVGGGESELTRGACWFSPITVGATV